MVEIMSLIIIAITAQSNRYMGPISNLTCNRINHISPSLCYVCWNVFDPPVTTFITNSPVFNIRASLYQRRSTNTRPTLDQHSINTRPTLDQHSINTRHQPKALLVMKTTACFLLSVLLVSLARSIDDEVDLDLTVFDENLINKFERQVSKLQSNEYQRFLSRLGKIAFFIRLVRRFARSPNVGRVNFEHFFPKPELPFHRKLYSQCREDVVKCVNFMFENIQSRASFLFPVKGQHIDDFQINEDNFNRLLTNNLFQFDVSISYLFCFLSKNQFGPMQQLPYCTYGVINGSKQLWPADRYKEFSQRSELIAKFGQEIEAIDELTNQHSFQCAEYSFCPNPCCGFQAVNAQNVKCPHPICQNAGKEKLCTMKNELNSNILGMVSNVWNLSCDCEKGHVFRFDVERCVDHNECADDENEEEICSADKHEKCMNTVGGFLCQCQMGFVRSSTTNQCEPVQFSPFKYSGPVQVSNSYESRAFLSSISSLIVMMLFFLEGGGGDGL